MKTNNLLTQKLCANVYINSVLRDRIIELLYEPFKRNSKKSISPSPGINQSLALEHALRAKFSTRARNVAMAILFGGYVYYVMSIFDTCTENADAMIKSIITSLEFIMVGFVIIFSQMAWSRWRALYILNGRDSLNGRFRYVNGLLRTRIDSANNANTIIYQGVTPFVGAGIHTRGWSFTTSINKPLPDCIPDVLNEEEIYKLVDQIMNETKISEAEVSDCLFVEGSNVAELKDALLDADGYPRTSLTPDEHGRLYESGLAHRYKKITIPIRSSQMILFSFFRANKFDDLLSIEMQFYTASPVEPEINNISILDCTLIPNNVVNMMNLLREMGTSAFLLFFLFLPVPGNLFLLTLDVLLVSIVRFLYREYYRIEAKSGHFNYGCNDSLRTEISCLSAQNLLEVTDRELHIQLLQRRILKSLTSLLEEKGIDSSDLSDKVTKVESNNITISESTINAENLAIGKRARSSKLGRRLAGKKKDAVVRK